MKIKRSWLASGIIVTTFVVSLSNSGCSDDDDTDKASARVSRKGEACQVTSDCAAGLACLPRSVSGSTSSSGSSTTVLTGGGTCVVGVFGLAPTGKECARVTCDTAQDCCDLNKGTGTQSFCDSLKDECEGPSPDPLNCESYKLTCTCDETRIGCEAGQCVTKCVDDGACKFTGTGSTAGKCLGGKCGQCAADADCKTPTDDKKICVNAKCQDPCKGDGDCEGLDRCVGGKCIEGGCQSSRECVALTQNVEATCGTDGKCITPCQTDLECGNPLGFRFSSCINNQCTYLGCDSDKDCKLQYDPDGSDTKVHYLCRDKGTPGNLVRSR